MSPKEKIYKTMFVLKEKYELSPRGTTIRFYAGKEGSGISVRDEILILNKLETEGVIKIVDNFSSEYI